jgi:uncharacterized protein (TIGR00159 family)
MPGWLQIVRWEDGVDILAVTVLAWLGIRYLRRTRVRTALLGLAMLGLFYATATALELRLTAALFQAFFAVVVLVLVVVFQEDLRRFFEQLGSWRPGRGRQAAESASTIALLVSAVGTLAQKRCGALIVLPRSEPLDRHLEGGIVLGGRLSEPLLLSLFDASSPGHDGAVVLRGDKVERFAVHLPLSTHHAALGNRGTRHAAALGLAELCDAVCIVVSEERGTVSVARDGTLRTVPVEQLAGILAEESEAGAAPAARHRHVAVDAAVALLGASLVWLVFVPGSDVSEVVLPAHVDIVNLPDDLVLEAVEPDTVQVTLRGLRRDLVLADEKAVRVTVDAYLARFGRRTFSLEEGDISHPRSLEVAGLAPEKLRISLRKAPVPEPVIP